MTCGLILSGCGAKLVGGGSGGAGGGSGGGAGSGSTSAPTSSGPTVVSVSSNTAAGSYKAGDSIDVRVTFSAAVNVIGTPTIELETGATDRTVNYASGTGTTTLVFTYTVQAGDTSADLDYKAISSLSAGTSIKDAAGNDATLTLPSPGAANSLSSNEALVIDTTAPTVSSVSASTANGSYKAGDTVDVTVTFSESVTVNTGGGTPYIVLETGATDRTVSYSSGSPGTTLTFTYTVQAGDTSTDLDYVATTSLSANSGTIRDAAGQDATLTLASPGAANSLGNNKAIVIDTTAPTVSSVSASTANGTYRTGDTVDVTVTFTEAVTVNTGGGTPYIVLETGGTDRSVSYSSGSPGTALTFTYTVQSGDTSSDLDYVATTSLVANGGTIRDATGNDATLTLASPGAANSLGNNKAIVIDTTAPTVSSVSASTANGTYKAGDTVDVTVTFTESVTVNTGGGTPYIVLETGTTDRSVSYSSGSPGTTLTFTYTVQSGDTSSDLDYVATTSLSANSGTIRDAAGNNATLTLASPGAANSLGNNKAIVIDTTAPTVSSVSASTADGTYSAGNTIDVTVTFTESVTVNTGGGTPYIVLETGTTDRSVSYSSGSPGTTLTFSYTVQSGDTSSDLDYVATTSLSANSGTIRDAAGNDATLTLASPGAANSLGANKAIVLTAGATDPSELRGFQFATGDFDRDGDMDIVVPNLASNQVTPYLNNGSGTFSAGTAVNVGTTPVAVAVGDFNRDGKLDIVVSNWGANTIGTLTGVGDGTFNAISAVTVGTNPAGLAVFDINKDGDDDVVVANYGDDTVQVVSNNGSGTMTAGSTTATGDGPSGVVAADFDRDGDKDVAVTNWLAGTVSVLATAAGAISTDETITVGTKPLGIVAADFNANGKIDLGVANFGSGTVSVSLNGGTSFGVVSNTTVGTQPVGIAATRWNSGGTLDIITANSGGNNYSMLSGVGDGTFGAASNTALTGTTPSGLTVADYNRNGETDAVFRFTAGGTAVELASGSGTTGNGSFTVQQTLSMAAGTNGPQAVALADLDKDGDLDLITGESNLDGIYVSLNDGAGSFGALTKYAFPTAGTQPLSELSVGDFDGDGDDDVIATHGNGITVYTKFLGNGTGGFGVGTAVSLGAGVYLDWISKVPVDYDRDGDLDFIGDDSNNGNLLKFANNASAAFTKTTAYAGYYGLRDMLFADFSRDGKFDIGFLEISGDGFYTGMGNGAGSFASESAYAASGTGGNPWGHDAQDYDNDGDTDVVVANSENAEIGVLKNDGTGGFGVVSNYNGGGSAMVDPLKVASGDFDSDGDIDIATTSSGNNYVYIFLNNGSGAFSYSSRIATGTTPYGIVVGDVNNDGKLDWIVPNSGTGNPSTLSIAFGN
jgi:uncharacterized protein YjhX (UPF0386 family)